MARVIGSLFCFRSVPLQFDLQVLTRDRYGTLLLDFERIKTGKIVGAGVRWHGICCKTKSQWGNRWLVEASLPSEQKPILPPTDQLRSLLTLPNSLSSSRARIRTSSGSYLSVWRYPCFYMEREGPQDYASGVAIRS